MSTPVTYSEFKHEAKELAKYIEAMGVFSIVLVDGIIVRFKPNDRDDFRAWLNHHEIPNILDC